MKVNKRIYYSHIAGNKSQYELNNKKEFEDVLAENKVISLDVNQEVIYDNLELKLYRKALSETNLRKIKRVNKKYKKYESKKSDDKSYDNKRIKLRM
ncbi:MAG: hypothetical protein K5769_10210 [Pseudobutyrivibrio sp.]|nr:hypothetical protein [Pseudobutyrivibrio sp.]